MTCLNAQTRPRRALLPLLVLAAAMLLVAGCGKDEKKEAARPPTEVTALTVTPRDVPIASVFVAQTQSSQAVNIAARVSGFLDKRVYTEGAVVKAGQVLFRMDPKPFQAQVDNAAKALYFPTISLTGALGGASAELSNLFTGAARAWNYTGQVVGPIFTFGAVSGQVAQSEAAQQAALFNYQFSIQNAFADVDNALVANQKLKEQLEAQERLVAALKEYARLAKLQYDGGYAPYSTVLQAEQTLFPAELTLAAVRASVFTSAGNTYKAMGGGWVTVADQLTGGPPSPPDVPLSRQPPF